jgi:hypothetical protein
MRTFCIPSFVIGLALALPACATRVGSQDDPPGAPSQVSGLIATASGPDTIQLAWSAATDNVGVTGYLIERCAGASCSDFAQVATASGTSYADSGLAASTSYTYRVRATDAAGNTGAYSSTATTTTGIAMESVTVAAGDDWVIPAWATVSANAGFYCDPAPCVGTPLPIAQLDTIIATWKQLEPSSGSYDWSAIDGAIAAKPGHNFWLRVYSTRVSDCPDWLATKYPGLPSRSYEDGVADDVFYYPWDPSFDTEFKAFLAAFRQHYVVDHPELLARIRFQYIPGGWRWNEYEVWKDTRSNGISVSGYVTWFNGLMDAYNTAMGDPGKLVLAMDGSQATVGDTSSGSWCYGCDTTWRPVLNPSNSAGNIHTDYMTQLGGGARSGNTETFNQYYDEGSWGTSATTINGLRYMVTDDNHPLISSTTRVFGTENECYGGCGLPNTFDYYNVKQSMLLALVLRMNWIFTTDGVYQLSPAFMNWMSTEQGKHVADSPDAWAELRQWTSFGSQSAPMNNWERWLVQREVPGSGVTVPADPRTSTWYANSAGKTWYEARSTSHATGSNYIYLAVNDKFIYGGSHVVQVKVTYLDNNTSTWSLEYDAADGNAHKASASVTNVNSGAWKTATFTLPDAAFQNRQESGNDFRIYNGGASDLTVQFVRVVKPSKF